MNISKNSVRFENLLGFMQLLERLNSVGLYLTVWQVYTFWAILLPICPIMSSLRYMGY